MRLFFAHGNGLPAAVYSPMLRRLQEQGHELHFLPRFGHDERFPITDGWKRLRDELLHHLQRLPPAPTVLVGHSMGGILGLMAAMQAPGIVRGLVMLDSPPFGGLRGALLRVLKAAGATHRAFGVSPHRRDRWPSLQDARLHLASRPMFSRWDPDVFDAFLQHGLGEVQGEYRLTFPKEVELAIFEATPHDLDRQIRRHWPDIPVGFLAGRQSHLMRAARPALSQRLAGERFKWVEGTHLFPLEHPRRTADDVDRLLRTFPQHGR